MRGRMIFISDVHLRPEGSPDSDELSGRFGEFLELAALAAERGNLETLYILGDLFDYWFELRGRIPDGFGASCELLRRATLRGLKIVVLPGNRDFLLGPAFERATGACLAAEHLELRLQSGSRAVRLLLAHGDSLVSNDRRYMVWKRFSRSPAFRRAVAGLGENAARLLAGLLRRGSELEKAAKPRESMDYARTALERLAEAGFDAAVAGHVHEAAEREVCSGGRACRMFSLGPWERSMGAFVEWDGERLRLVRAAEEFMRSLAVQGAAR